MRFEIRDIQNRVKIIKIRRKVESEEKSKSENDYVLLNISVTVLYKKKFTF